VVLDFIIEHRNQFCMRWSLVMPHAAVVMGDNALTLPPLLLERISFKTAKIMGFIGSMVADKVMSLYKVTWNFINDSYRTTLCLQYDMRFIGIAALNLTFDLLKMKVSPSGSRIVGCSHTRHREVDMWFWLLGCKMRVTASHGHSGGVNSPLVVDYTVL
jgi:hypothetical protein